MESSPNPTSPTVLGQNEYACSSEEAIHREAILKRIGFSPTSNGLASSPVGRPFVMTENALASTPPAGFLGEHPTFSANMLGKSDPRHL
jgi:hypothetical protein